MDYKDTYDTDTSRAQQALSALSSKVSGAADKIGGAASSLGEMKGKVEGAADSVEIFKVGLGPFIGENEKAIAAVEDLAGGAQSVAFAFAIGGPLLAGVAAAAVGFQIFAKAGADAGRTATELKENLDNIRGVADPSARAVKALQESLAELSAKKKLTYEESIRYVDLLGFERQSTESLTKAVEARTKRQAELTAELAAEKAAQEELDRLRNLPNADQQEAAKRAGEYLGPEETKRLVGLVSRYETGSAALNYVKSIQSGDRNSVRAISAEVASDRDVTESDRRMLADLLAISEGRSTDAQRIAAATPAARIPGVGLFAGALPAAQQGQANFDRQYSAANDLAARVDDASGDAGQLGRMYMELSQRLDAAKRDRDILLQGAISSLQDSVMVELENTAKIRANIGQSRPSLLRNYR